MNPSRKARVATAAALHYRKRVWLIHGNVEVRESHRHTAGSAAGSSPDRSSLRLVIGAMRERRYRETTLAKRSEIEYTYKMEFAKDSRRGVL